MEHRFFPNRRSFWIYMEPKCKGRLDLSATLRLRSILQFVTVEGTTYTPKSTVDFAEKMGKEFGIVIDGKKTTMVNNRMTLFWDDEAVYESVEETPVEAVEPTSEVVEEEPVEVVEEVEESPTEASDEESEVDVDWAWVASLENNTEDKLKLDEYAEKFGVSLSRRKTLENMIVDFKNEIDG